MRSENLNKISYLTILGPEPAFGQLGLDGLSGGYSSYGYTSHASLRACGAQLGGDNCLLRAFNAELGGENVF